MFEIIKSFIENIEDKNKIVESIINKADSKIKIQFALTMCKLTKSEIYVLNNAINLLDEYGTSADFYSFLESISANFSNEDAELVINIIDSASYGKYSDDFNYEKYVITHKLTMYNLLKNKHDLFKEQYDSLKNQEHFDIINPVESACDKAPKSMDYHPPKAFAEGELDGMTVLQMIEKVNKKKEYNEIMFNREQHEEYIDYLVKQERFNELLEALIGNNTSFDDICSIISVINSEKYKSQYTNINILNLISKLIEKIEIYENSEEKDILVKNIFYILEQFGKIQSCQYELMKIVLNIKVDKLWDDSFYKNPFDESETISCMINNGECSLYLLMFSIIVALKKNNKNFVELMQRFEKYSKEKIISNNKWFILASAYNFQNHFYLNKNWAEKITPHIFSSSYICEAVVLSCTTSNVIMKTLLDIIFSDNVLSTILDDSSFKNERKNRVVEYVTAGYVFNMITEEQYDTFLSYIKEPHVSSVFKAISQTRCDETKSSNKSKIVIYTFNALKNIINESHVLFDIIEEIFKIPNKDKQIWDIICDCMNKIDNTKNRWYNFNYLYENINFEESPDYLASFEIFVRKFNTLNEETLFYVLNGLKENNKKPEYSKIYDVLIDNAKFRDVITSFMEETRT